MRFNAFRKNLLESEQDEILSINDKVKDLAQRDPKALDYAIDAIKKAR